MCKKKLYHYLIYLIIGLMILSIALTRKILSAVVKIKILQALDYRLKRGIVLLALLK